MSVMGELARYVDDLIVELDGRTDPSSESLRNALRAARPSEPSALSARADEILTALEDAGLADEYGQDLPPTLRDAAQAVAKLCRIVLGR
jgi:hypothetical protein